jgi:DMSO/TMAO reductase YedYZ heme-binding membrane subunit
MIFGLFLGFAALFIGLRVGADTVESWRLAARWTARVGFPLFILAYAASSLGRLWPSPLTRALWRDRRWWGLGFAAAHTVHLGALLKFLQVSGETRPLAVLLVAGTGYALMFAMALTSNEAAMRALGKNWRRLHSLGIHWLWFVFFASYAGRIMKPESMMTGLVGTSVAVLALGLRIAVWLKGRNRTATA